MTNSAALRIGTRGSQLALYQARTVAALVGERAGVACEIVVIRTSGDRLAEAALSEIGGKRLFVKEIEDALLAGDVDLAVHSSKDMPVVLPAELEIGAVLPREDPRDALVLPGSVPLSAGALPLGAVRDAGLDVGLDGVVARLGQTPRIGTSSVRRSAQLRSLFPGGSFLPIRGNLDTRLHKVDAHDFDVIVLAAAGLRRLEQGHRISATVPVETCVPAPGQGIIAIEMRGDDDRMRRLLEQVNDREARAALEAERATVVRLGGGCQMPIGAYAAVTGDRIAVTAVVISLDGTRAIRAAASGALADAVAIGTAVAADLLAHGASEILADVERSLGAVTGRQP